MKKIAIAAPNFLGNERKYVQDCMDTVWISSVGKYIGEFETAFANRFGVKEAISCSNGTVALHLALLAAGIGSGDEVMVPSLTYIATANAVRYCGAKPIFVDCLPTTWNIDIADAVKKLTPKTKAIIPVHLYGNPCDMDAVLSFANENDLLVIEDAAECHGASYKGKLAGTIGDIGTFSFFGNKIITTGEGGMLVTNNPEFANRIRLLKGQGQDPKRRYWFVETGYNYRMTNIEAAIGLGQLEKLDEHIIYRKKVAEQYDELFEGHNCLTLQATTPEADNVNWMYSILLSPEANITRDELMAKLEDDGIETRPLFYPMHIMPPFYDKMARCPIAEDISGRGMNIPTHSLLECKDIEYVAEKILFYLEH